MKQDEAFKSWWHNEGSQAPYTHHDCEEHTMLMCEIAWANGAYKEREACAKLVGEFAQNYSAYELASIIRARGQA